MPEPEPVFGVRSAPTEELSDLELTELRVLLQFAFEGEFSDDDWDHALGGRHFLGTLEDRIVAHASVVPRVLRAGERALDTGFVEAVAVADEHRRRGYGHRVMGELGDFLIPRFELGALSAAEEIQPFYANLGWETWPGPTGVTLEEGPVQPTPDEDGGVMILRTPTTGPLDPDVMLACDWRAGDAW
jgi:aminoglycoside 2'-N-acetyltransferase I